MSDHFLQGVAASELATASLLSALIHKLVEKTVLSDQDAKDVYETALLSIEQKQGSAPASTEVFIAAREMIEQHLRPKA